MASSDPKDLSEVEPASAPLEEQLSGLFGSFRAEWLQEQIFDLFTEPSYFPELVTPRPCVLLGGRGTGKTTVLRCLSYEGQFALRGRDRARIADWKYIGFYYRVNTNRVAAFQGPELPEARWKRVFAHYLNLVLAEAVLRFVSWYELQSGIAVALGEADCARIAASLHLPPAADHRTLHGHLVESQARLEAQINNVVDDAPRKLSLQGAAIDDLVACLLSTKALGGRRLFFLIDEYENFLDYQQQVVNTLIKHASAYTFKVGVRDLGWRCRTTLNHNEQLISPSDYVRINIADALSGVHFSTFAERVCDERLTRLRTSSGPVGGVRDLLPGLAEDEEAALLDGGAGLLKQAQERVSSMRVALSRPLSPLESFFVCQWADAKRRPLESIVEEVAASPGEWETRYNNYKYSLLFTIRRGRRGIRKYYAGWTVFTELAAGNIRYLLELVVQSLLLHIRETGTLTAPLTAKVQTLAAQGVGRKNLADLEGLSVHGAQLTKLLLGLGRVFQTMAADAVGHAPEVNQFHVSGRPGDISSTADGRVQCGDLLRAAVMHLALVRFPGNKLADEGDTRDYDYMVHPIFAPFFEFSHRRKRKLVIGAEDLVGLVVEPKETIRRILEVQNRTPEEELPEQLRLFEGYYHGRS